MTRMTEDEITEQSQMVHQMAQDWVQQNLGLWRQYKRKGITQTQVEQAFVAGFAACLDYAADRLKRAAEAA